MAAILTFSGCGPNQESAKATATAITPQFKPEVDSYYPELKALPLYASGEFYTQKTTKWLNFTRRNFDPAIAQMIFNFFEKLANTQKVLEYKIGDQTIPFFLDQRARNQRVFFIVPENAPPPSWPNVTPEASTTGIFENGPYVSMTRVHNLVNTLPPSRAFTTIETAFNKSFSTESCQSSLLVRSVSTDAANLGQEIICNSYGAAFTIRQMRIPYQDYQDWAKGVKISKNPSSPSYPLYVLSIEDYNEIPITGLILH